MLDFVVVDHAEAAPYECAATGDRTGPFIYTHRDLEQLPGSGPIYISRSAVRRMALAFGLVKGGKKHEELVHAAEVLSERDKLYAAQSQVCERLAADLEARNAEVFSLQDTVSIQLQRIAQLEGLLRRDAEATLAVVGT